MEDALKPLRDQVQSAYSQVGTDAFCLIPTSRNLHALVDRRHATEIGRYNWYAIISRGGYVSAAADVKGSRISLQRLVVSLETGRPISEIKQVTFSNKITFDCRFENLVPKSGRTSVMQNRRGKRGSSSKFKGVRMKPRKNGGASWSASIKADIGSIGLGTYETEREAALVYDAAAYHFFKEAAHFNIPDEAPDREALSLVMDRVTRFRNMRAKRGGGTE